MSNSEQNRETAAYIPDGMASNGRLLCIHRDPAQLDLLREKGYELLTATTGSDGLRLLMSRSVDAIVLEYHLGLLDGAVVADEIKKAKPHLPVVMLSDDLELPEGALKSVDALVTKSDGPHFLWATVHFVLTVKPTLRKEEVPKTQTVRLRRTGNSRVARNERRSDAPLDLAKAKDVPFSPGVWRKIRTGQVNF